MSSPLANPVLSGSNSEKNPDPWLVKEGVCLSASKELVSLFFDLGVVKGLEGENL
jgi:hypothetical protein